MAIKFTIRCLLPLPIWWHGFLPDNQDDWLKFSTKQENKEVIVTIGITDRSSQMEVIGDLDISKELFFPWQLPGNHFPERVVTRPCGVNEGRF